MATRQYGVVSRAQLREAGWSDGQIKRRIASGYLRRILHGVYSVGHDSLTLRSRWFAAVLFGGAGAVLSHRSAAALWGLRDRAPSVVEVCRKRQRFLAPGLRVHTSGRLYENHATTRERIPVTTPARTLIDIAGCVSARELDDHLSAARRLGLLDPEKIRLTLGDLPRQRGNVRLAGQIGLFEEAQGVTRSELETRFLRLCSEGDLPLPEADVPIASGFVDFHWHEQRLIVEVDSRTFHSHRFDEDRIRDLAHLVNGYRTVRVTHAMMEQAPGRLIESLRRLLMRSPEAHGRPIDREVTSGR